MTDHTLSPADGSAGIVTEVERLLDDVRRYLITVYCDNRLLTDDDTAQALPLAERIEAAKRSLLAEIARRDERVRDLEVERLNYAAKLEDEERRRWYRALEAAGLRNLEGLSPESVIHRLTAQREALSRLATQWRKLAADYRQDAENDDTHGRDAARADVLQVCADQLTEALASIQEPG